MSLRQCCLRELLCPLVLLVLSSVLHAGATTNVVLFQESFESPAVTNATGFNVVGWVREHNYTQLWNENYAPHIVTPYGEQVAAIWSASGIRTTNMTDRVQAGVTYTLTFSVGNVNTDSGTPDINEYKAEILAGTNVLASTSAVTDSSDLSDFGVVTCTTDGTNAYLGATLGIRFSHLSGTWRAKTLIDNVKLVADESASEWKHTLFLGK